jgi:hypothetical protein
MNRETPAGYSRSLHKYVKAMRSELVASGYPRDMMMVLLLDVMKRLAEEQASDATMMAMIEQMVKENHL